MRTGRLRQLGPDHAGSAYTFCQSLPHQCAFIAGWIRDGGLRESPRVSRGWLLADISPQGAIEGLVYISDTGIVLPSLPSLAARDDVVQIGRDNPNAVRVLVGARDQVDYIWQGLRRSGAHARQIRNQAGYSVDQQTFVDGGTVALQVAELPLLDQLVQASAAMAREEARDDPQRRNPPLFRERIRERMMRGRDLVHVDDDRLLFKSNVAAISPIAGQIEGIYTLPSARGQGIGTRGTSAVTRWVLERAEQAFLLVNDDNLAARRLYERLGYQQVLQSQTVFIAP